MDDWQIELLESCADVDGAAVGEGAFASGPALWVGKSEVAHFDGERTLDVRLTREVIRRRRDELKQDPRVQLRKGTSDWVAAAVATDADIRWARALIRDAVAANRPSAPPGPPPGDRELEQRRRFH